MLLRLPKGKTRLEYIKPDRPEPAQVEITNNSKVTANTTGSLTEAGDIPDTAWVDNSQELGDSRSDKFTEKRNWHP